MGAAIFNTKTTDCAADTRIHEELATSTDTRIHEELATSTDIIHIYAAVS